MDLDPDTLRKPLLDLLRAAHRPITVKVEGKSMLPFLRTGDSVRIKTCSASEIEVGAILAYETKSGLAVHRVLRKSTEQGEVRLYQAGDNLTGGSWLRQAQVVGKVVAVIRKDGQEVAIIPEDLPSPGGCHVRYLKIQFWGSGRRLIRVPSQLPCVLSRLLQKGTL